MADQSSPPIVPSEPWVESPFFEELLRERDLTPEQQDQARSFHDHGFLVLENLFPDGLLEQVRGEVEPLFDPELSDPRKSKGRFQDAWLDCPAVRSVALDAKVDAVLRMLYGRRPVPFQTLNFCVGTEQRGHADSIHFSCIPPRFMCGVWVALEDVDERNGTLFYYPGSHRLPEYDFNTLGLRLINPNSPGPKDALTYQDYDRYEDFIERLMNAHGLKRRTLQARKGTALIWAANLVHGGSAIREPGSSRWSQVTHYYFEDCLYYSPILSSLPTGDLHLKRITDVRTGAVAPASFRGLPLPELPDHGIYKLWLDYAEDEDLLRLATNDDIKGSRDRIDQIVGSLSFRLGRLLTSPLRAIRRLLGGR